MKMLQNSRTNTVCHLFEKNRNKSFSKEKSRLIMRVSKMKSALRSNQIPIAPSSLKRYSALLLLSLMLFSSPLLARGLADIDNPRALSSITYSSILHQEKLGFIAGKNDSLLASLSLDGGQIDLNLALPSSTLYKLSDFSIIVSNQTHFQDVWTNPLWQYPTGLNVKFTIRSQNPSVIEGVIRDIMDLINDHYTTSSSVYSLNSIHEGVTKVLLFAPINSSLQKELFETTFQVSENINDGSFTSIFYSQFLSSPSVYAFGFSFLIDKGQLQYLSRRAILSLKERIPIINGERVLELSSILGNQLIPNAEALYSSVELKFPFLANFTLVHPQPTNVAAQLSGVFQWVLKTPLITIYPSFNASLHYLLSLEENIHFPRVIVTNSYSDKLIKEEGIFRMTYEVENIGDVSAYNTSLYFPIPQELQVYSKENISIPVLKSDIEINSSFSTDVRLKIDVPFLISETDLLLKILGWYRNVTTDSLERWNSTTQIPLYGNQLVLISDYGFPSDLVNLLVYAIIPSITSHYDNIYDLGSDIDKVIELLYLSLISTYNTTFYAFYEMKSIFNFQSDDFHLTQSPFGDYLTCIIPEIQAGEKFNVNWSLENIPTEYDRVGIYNLTAAQNEGQIVEYHAIFQTKGTDYETLLLSKYAETNSSGRILSEYDSFTNSFVNIGLRFKYSDKSGEEYYGLTNGVNIQIGDDEAILQSKLSTSNSVYRVGDTIFLTLNITNRGQISAYNVNVEITNMKLDFLWQPTDILRLKTLVIDEIKPNESFIRTLSLKANSYIGLNTYIAFISFISDKGQSGEIITDPWTNETLTWTYGGETKNIVTSSLVSGLLLPSQLSHNSSRTSFPLPEITTKVNYQMSSDNSSVIVEYRISNTGLSETNVTIGQFLENSTYSFLESVTVSKGENFYDYTAKSYLSYVELELTNQVSLQPGETIIITEVYSSEIGNLSLSPLQIDYYSLYEIVTTDFQTNTNTEENNSNAGNLVFLSPLNVSESEQTKFKWSSYSDDVNINIPPIEEEKTNLFVVTFPEIHYLYILTSIGVTTVTVGLLSLISLIFRKKRG